MYPISTIQEAPGGMISGGFVSWRVLRYRSYSHHQICYSTIALFASGPFRVADASVLAISTSAITSANSAIE
jgi:hypothetical protein